ncbi:uncharacterized protein LOC6652385 isoform X3 [Drosophila willistoni]|uniref:uncharacterized protein LOC6652385 isoform X3 n=1 Tax=Drosophila willistoni TaxID=7260 RepID=UPI000C26C57E|nr:uncharacterized protein LOC6652385 isoform X3 [Drosophila willistoni]
MGWQKRVTFSSWWIALVWVLFVNAEMDFNVGDTRVPLIEPQDVPVFKQTPYVKELMNCKQLESEVVFGLLLKMYDWSELSADKRAQVKAKLATFFAIPKEFVYLDSISKHELNAMHLLSIHKGGEEIEDIDYTKQPLGRASFVIGCGENLFNMGKIIANEISHQIKDGTINALTEENFGKWMIFKRRKELTTRSDRVRRQSQNEGSGADNDEDYDYGDEDVSDLNTEVPAVSTTHAHRHHHVVLGSIIDIPSSTFAPVEIPATLDYLEPSIENSPPIIKTRLRKLAVTSGKAFQFIVPEQTFADAEDYNNLRLELTDMDGNELKGSSWMQFNSDKRELYGLPLDDTVSRWQYCLTATDSSNASATEIVEISVQQHRAVRTINHEISIAVEIVDNNGRSIDWQLKLIHALVQTLNDLNSAAVVVREIRQPPQNLHNATFVYFNETLPSIECPEEALNDILRSLDVHRLNELVQPILSIKSIAGNLIGSCQKVELNQIKPTITVTKNLPPMPRNQVDRVNASVGQLMVYRVPSDTFYDPNDNDLTLTLKSKDHKELSTRQWLQFDSKNQEFFGIPKSGDIGSEEYLLVAEDSGGLSATDALVVVVTHAHKKEFSTLFKAYLAIRHENFNADLQRKFVERIAKLHNDANTNKIQVRSITTHHDSDGTIVNFYNTSLFKIQNRCPDKELAATRNVYLDNDQMLREGVKLWMGPELNLTNFSVVPIGSCHLTDYNAINPHDYIPKRPEEPRLKSTFSEQNLTTFVLPAIIIVVMILLASIIACCLHRRRNKSGKMELGDDEERKSFRNKGIPVIFQDEFEEKPEMGNKSPVILKDEKPPLLPPSYNSSNMNGDNDVDEYVPPPAVVLGGREARGKSPATPSYRKPPPYVSP